MPVSCRLRDHKLKYMQLSALYIIFTQPSLILIRKYIGGILLAALLLGFPALAQPALPVEQVCGPSSEEVSTSEKANLDAKAQTLLKIGSVNLQGAAEKTRTEIMVNSNRSDGARLILYLKRISCVLIYQDTSLSTDEKLQRIQALQSGLTLPPAGSTQKP
jgi:hypothetical protein